MVKKKGKHFQADLMNEGDNFIHDENRDATLVDENMFINDTPRAWVARKKEDNDGLGVRHHLLIFHITIKARWYPDDLYPTTKDKCIQYYEERNLKDISVTINNFYKSYSNVEYSKVQILDEDGNPKSIRKKYISLELIDKVSPFILKWYTSAAFFILTLNNTHYNLDEEDYYWIYRKIKDYYPQEFKYFFDKNCPHLNFNTFSSTDQRKCDSKIPTDLNGIIDHYIREYFPKAVEGEIKQTMF